MHFLFWCAAAAVLFSYAGYPILVGVFARLSPSRTAQHKTHRPLTRVTILLPVHNEEAVIREKIENTQALNYPRSLLQFLIVSDGSTDGTETAVKQAAALDGTIQLISLPKRSGKETALNAGLKQANGDILVFTDASIMLEPECLGYLVGAFSKPGIGCVSGEDRIEGGAIEGLYGRYELFLRRQESAIYSLVGASGCIYAQRRDLCRLFVPGLAPDLSSALATIEQGYRSIAEPRARGVMKAARKSAAEFQRKCRTVLRGIATITHHRSLLNPIKFGRFSLLLFCHKILRWLVPFFLLLMLISSALLTHEILYRAFFAAQLALYGLGLAAWLDVRPIAQSAVGRLAAYLAMSNVAVLVAWARWAWGSRQLTWAPTSR